MELSQNFTFNTSVEDIIFTMGIEFDPKIRCNWTYFDI